MNATLLFAAIALGAPALKDPPKKGTDLIGEWILDSTIIGGKTELVGHEIRWRFNADGTRTIRHYGKLIVDATYDVDATAKPAALDLNPGAPGHCHYPCIYKVSGNTLTINVGWATADRPIDFECVIGSQCSLYVFQRARAKD